MKDDDDAGDNIAAINPFELRDGHRLIAQDCEFGTIDLGRGDPDFPTHLRADWLNHLFTRYALEQRIAATLGDMDPVRDARARTIAAFSNQPELQQDAETAFRRLDRVQQSTEMSVEYFYGLITQAVMGVHYGDPEGEVFARSILADHLNRLYAAASGERITPSELVITAGAGEAIGAAFRCLVEAGYLAAGDKVGVISPVYSPYVHIVERLGLQVITLECLAENDFEPTDIAFETFEQRGQGMKLLILVDPNNPTGRKSSASTVERLKRFAQAEQAVVMIDAVYKELLADPCAVPTLFEALERQSLLIWSASKAHRSTGLRFGAVAWTSSGEQWLLKRIYGEPQDKSLQNVLIGCKSLERPLSHVTLVPLNAQLLGTLRLIMADSEGPEYREELWKRNHSFRQGLNLPLLDDQSFVPYYILFDMLADVAAPRAQTDARYAALVDAMQQDAVHPLDLLDRIAHKGVCLLYAAPFFGETAYLHRWAVRVSVANHSADAIAEAAWRVSKCLDELAQEAFTDRQNGRHGDAL